MSQDFDSRPPPPLPLVLLAAAVGVAIGMIIRPDHHEPRAAAQLRPAAEAGIDHPNRSPP